MKDVFPLILVAVCVFIIGVFVTKNEDETHALRMKVVVLEVKVAHLIERLKEEK